MLRGIFRHVLCSLTRTPTPQLNRRAMTNRADSSTGGALVKRTPEDADKKPTKGRQVQPRRPLVQMRELTTFRRNELFTLLRDQGLNLSEFTWDRLKADYWDPEGMNAGKHSIPALKSIADSDVFLALGVFPESDSYIRFGYAPACETEAVWDETGDWGRIKRYIIQDWVPAVKAHQTGDLWAHLEEQRAAFAPGNASTNNSALSGAEQNRIESSIDDLLARVRELKLFQREQYERFAAVMAHQKKAAGWLGRIDWLNAFTGAVFGQLMSAAMSPQNVQQFLSLAAGAVSWLSGHLPQLPAPQ